MVERNGWPAMGLEGGRGMCFNGEEEWVVGLGCHHDTGGAWGFTNEEDDGRSYQWEWAATLMDDGLDACELETLGHMMVEECGGVFLGGCGRL